MKSPIVPTLDALRHRERATLEGLRALDSKIQRLRTARAERAAALDRLRSVIAHATLGQPAADHDYAR